MEILTPNELFTGRSLEIAHIIKHIHGDKTQLANATDVIFPEISLKPYAFKIYVLNN